MRTAADLDLTKSMKWNRFIVDATCVALIVDDQLQRSPRFPQDVAAGAVDHQAIKAGLNRRHLGCDLLT